jgi:hypothetical protein
MPSAGGSVYTNAVCEMRVKECNRSIQEVGGRWRVVAKRLWDLKTATMAGSQQGRLITSKLVRWCISSSSHGG